MSEDLRLIAEAGAENVRLHLLKIAERYKAEEDLFEMAIRRAIDEIFPPRLVFEDE